MEHDADTHFVHESTELDEILSEVSDLEKWREIFNGRGLQLQNNVLKRPPEKAGLEETQEGNAGKPAACTCPVLRSLPCSLPSSVPQTLVTSPSLGGLPVQPEQAVNLRKILFGNTVHIFSYEWKKSIFRFREAHSELSYALEAEKGASRAIQMAVQANIIKYLLFSCHSNTDSNYLHSLGEKEQQKALAAALSNMLWTAGEEQSATVTLVTSMPSFIAQPGYQLDSITERLQLFTFSTPEDVCRFIYEHIQCFQDEGSHGIILFLYSLIFSRTFNRLSEDLDPTTSHLLHLSRGNFVCSQALLNLLLTGRASPNVFNGFVQSDDAGAPLERPLRGVLARSDVGYLYWSREHKENNPPPQVGSMLKTPKLPVWVCNINSTYSILFSPNRLLLSDWRTEHLFDLYFYNGQPSQTRTAQLTIDTQSHHWEAETIDNHGDLEKRFPSVDMTIRTKWEGAIIDWNGTPPFF